MNREEKIKLINNYLKNKEILLDIKLINYETYNLYFRLDYIKKLKIFKLYFIDLDLIKDKKIEKYLNIEVIPVEVVNQICDIIEKITFFEYKQDKEINKNKVEIKTYYLTNNYHFIFNKFIPKELSNLKDVFITLFNYLPRNLEEFLQELHAEIMNTKENYLYNNEIYFDLYNDDLTNIFNKKILDKATKHYEENKVTFLEKLEDKCYIIVKGNEEYLVVIKYDELNNITSMYCTCPCEFFCTHIALAILAIRNNYKNKFYKVLSISKNDTLLDISKNKYYLSLGVGEDYIKIINKYGEIELVPLYDEKDNLIWKILEDSKDKTLYKEIKNIKTQ